MSDDDQEEKVVTTTMTVAEIAQQTKTGVLKLPQYQRKVVWGAEAKALLIDSLLKRYPIGALLIHKRVEISGEDCDLVIDGLQRITTMLEHVEAPLGGGAARAIADGDDTMHGLVETLKGALEESWQVETSTEGLLGELDHYFDKIKIFPEDFEDRIVFTETFAEHLRKRQRQIPEASQLTTPDFKSVGEAGRAIYKHMRERLDIAEIKVPVLAYQGSGQNLPEIFQRVNRQGIKLSEYDLLAAHWFGERLGKTSKQIERGIRAKFDQMLDAGNLAFDGYERGGDLTRLTLYEYLLGLGALMSEKGTVLFASAVPGEVLRNAFHITALAHGLALEELTQLPKVLKRNKNKELNLNTFEEALIKVIDWLQNDVFGGIGKFPLNKYENKGTFKKLPHAEFLINSIIVSVLWEWFDPEDNWAERESFKKDDPDLHRKIKRLYTHDVVSSFWTGPLYSLVLDRLWSNHTRTMALEDRAKQLSPNGIGFPFYEGKQIQRAIQQSFDEQSLKKHKTRQDLDAAGQLILRIVYSRRSDHQRAHDIKWHLDHTVPVNFLQRPHLNTSSEDVKWCINHWANMALIPSSVNLTKSKQTALEFTNLKDGQTRTPDQDAMETALVITRQTLEKEGLEPIFGENFDETEFELYLDLRKDALYQDICEFLDLEQPTSNEQ